MATIDEARAVKQRLAAQLGAHPAVTGVGITRLPEGFAVKVNLSRAVADLDVPDSVDSVPVRVEVVGRITAR